MIVGPFALLWIFFFLSEAKTRIHCRMFHWISMLIAGIIGLWRSQFTICKHGVFLIYGSTQKYCRISKSCLNLSTNLLWSPPYYVACVLMYYGFHLLTADEMKPNTNFDKRVYLAFTKKFKSLQEDSFLWWWWWSHNSEKCDRSVESKRGRLPSTTQQQRGLGKWTLWKCSRVRTPLEMICNFSNLSSW